jgi:glycosyltransferase involved in cell wall biosynthesis
MSLGEIGDVDGVRPCLLGEGWPPDRPGGLNRYVCDLVAALQAEGLQPEAVVVGPAVSAPEGVTVVGDASQPIWSRLRTFTRAAATVAARSDLLDIHFALYGLLPSITGPGRRQPRVVHFHGPWADEGKEVAGQHPVITFAKRRIERMVYRRATEVVTLSGAFRQLAVERYRVPPWRTSVIPPAVDLDRFAPGDRPSARARWSLPPEAHAVSCVRRLVPRMGISDLLQAWAAMSDTSDRVLLIAGDGPSLDALAKLAADLGIARSVRFLGRLTEAELVDLYRASDICVVPSKTLEGFGLVVLEALACGTPVIVTDSGGLPEAVSGLCDDAIVPVGRPELLAARIDGALDGSLPLPDSRACRKYAETYSSSRMARAHIALYRRAAERRVDSTMRVVFLDHCAALSGAEIAMLRLIESVPDISAHVILAEDGPLVGRLIRAGVSVEVLPLDASAGHLNRDKASPTSLPIASAAHTAAYVARLAVRLRDLRPDVVHCNSLKACLYGATAARAAGIPAVWHARDRMASDYLPDAAARVVRLAYRALPAAAIANSHATLTTFGPVRPARRVDVIPDPFCRTRGVTPMPDGPLRIGVVGRLADWKGQHVVLDAFARAFPAGPQRCAVVGAALFGEDAYADSLVAQAARLGIVDRVEFRGFRSDIEREMDALHVVVHASVVPEPFGQVVVEAMAAGRAVVATSTGGPAEIIETERDGLLYPAGDVDALAALLRRLDAEPDLRERLGTAATARAADFDPALVGSAVRDVYRSVARGR